MTKRLIAIAAVALALTGCTTRAPVTATATTTVTAPAAAEPKLGNETEDAQATTIATESRTLAALIARTTTDAQNYDTQAVVADCAALRASSAQWNVDLDKFEARYPGALAKRGADPTGAQASVASLLTSCSLLGG